MVSHCSSCVAATQDLPQSPDVSNIIPCSSQICAPSNEWYFHQSRCTIESGSNPRNMRHELQKHSNALDELLRIQLKGLHIFTGKQLRVMLNILLFSVVLPP